MLYPGGNAVNVAVHGRRCGAGTAYIGAVGTDLRRAVLDALVAEGVDTSLLRVVEGPNAYADVRVVDGNRVFDHGDPGVSRFALTPADFAAVAAASIVHTGECSMVEEQLADLSAAAPRPSTSPSVRTTTSPHTPPRRHRHPLAPLRDKGGRRGRGPPHPGPGPRPRGGDERGWRSPSTRDSSSMLRHHPRQSSTRSEPVTPSSHGSSPASSPRHRSPRLGDATAYASSTCATFGAFGYETSLEGLTAPLNPIHKGVDLS